MKSYLKLLSPGIALLFSLLVMVGCQKEEGALPQNNAAIEERADVVSASGLKSTTVIYGLSAENEIVTFMFGPPVTETSSFPITGLRDGESIIAIDIRPSTKQVFGVSDMSLLYTINPSTGVATAVSGIPFSPALTGTMVGMDFQTSADVIRIVTDTDQNLRISPTTGAVVAVDRPISPSTASINGIAYAGTGSSSSFSASLYDLNAADGTLYYQADSRGGLMKIGSTGLFITGEGGFDILGGTGLAFLYAHGTHNNGNEDKTNDWTVDAYRLYAINLRTGLATQFGMVRPMIGIAVQG